MDIIILVVFKTYIYVYKRLNNKCQAMKTKKLCLYCNEPIEGRADKKFCSAQCRSAYHNQQQNSVEATIKTINKQLRANRNALKIACPQGKATVRKDFLRSLGMDFKHLPIILLD